MKIITAFLICAAVLMFGCGADNPGGPKPGAQSQEDTGRPETRAIKAADAIGYDGSGMRGSVDKALDQNDARNAEMKKAIDQANGK